MAFGEIRPIDRSCRSYRPGHQVHWIQAKKSVEDQQPVIDVAVVVRDDGRVAIDGDELKLTMWNHDPDRTAVSGGLLGSCCCDRAPGGSPGTATPAIRRSMPSTGR